MILTSYLLRLAIVAAVAYWLLATVAARFGELIDVVGQVGRRFP